MQDEEIDKLIKDAANQHHPPYDDSAWGKMEAMLDKHLPQKKDKKKPLLFLLFSVLLGGAVITGVLQPWKDKSRPVENTTAQQPVTSNEKPNITADNNLGNKKQDNNTVSQLTNQQTSTGYRAGKKNVTTTVSNSNTTNNPQQTANSNKNTYRQQGKTSMKIKKPGIGTDIEEDKTAANSFTDEEPKDEQIENPVAPTLKKQNPIAISPTDTVSIAVTAKKEIDTAKEKYPSVKEKQKKKNAFINNFALTFSAGADVSYIDIDNPGKLQSFYGAGVSYTIGKHLRLNTGLYVSKKIYTAEPYQYKFSSGTVNPNLKKIDANCNVYEIPLNVYYNFKTVKNHNWFAGTGISSYLMKKETYDYIYLTPSGQTYNYIHTETNQNKHYFSVLTLSGGYQYKLNNRFSFIAEPYLKIPLSGVGAGKVKLNSAGIVFTAAIKPFSKAKK
jgi:hypothetical protein